MKLCSIFIRAFYILSSMFFLSSSLGCLLKTEKISIIRPYY